MRLFSKKKKKKEIQRDENRDSSINAEHLEFYIGNECG